MHAPLLPLTNIFVAAFIMISTLTIKLIVFEVAFVIPQIVPPGQLAFTVHFIFLEFTNVNLKMFVVLVSAVAVEFAVSEVALVAFGLFI